MIRNLFQSQTFYMAATPPVYACIKRLNDTSVFHSIYVIVFSAPVAPYRL